MRKRTAIKKIIISSCSFWAILTLSFPAYAQEDINDEDLKKLIAIQKTEIDSLKQLSQEQGKLIAEQAEIITELSGKLEAVSSVTARLEKALPTDGSLWLKGQKVIDAGGGWHRSYGNTGWYNGTHGGGWHMTDNTWIRSYGGKDVYVDKVVRADNGFQVDGKQIIAGDGKVLVSPHYSKEYTWKKGSGNIKMEKADQYACYLTDIHWQFEKVGSRHEWVTVFIQGGWWILGGMTSQTDVSVNAICVTFR